MHIKIHISTDISENTSTLFSDAVFIVHSENILFFVKEREKELCTDTAEKLKWQSRKEKEKKTRKELGIWIIFNITLSSANKINKTIPILDKVSSRTTAAVIWI